MDNISSIITHVANCAPYGEGDPLVKAARADHAKLLEIVEHVRQAIARDERRYAYLENVGPDGHGHSVKGRWDSDGSECHLCTVYDLVRKLDEKPI